MKTVRGWWFGTEDKRLGYGDGRKIVIGKTHKVEGKIIPCERGLHLSVKPLDALRYASRLIIYKVVGSGTVISHGNPVDKYACSERTYIAGGVDASETLRTFARLCALDVIDLWDAPDVVIKYLKTGDESLRLAASWAASSAGDLARSAASLAAQKKQNHRLATMLGQLIAKGA